MLTLALCGAGAAQATDKSAVTSTAAATPAPELRVAFQDFFARPVGPSGLQLSPTLLAAHGRQVRLVGYMVAREQAEPGRFLLTPRPVHMSEHADGEADDLPPATVTVLLPADQAATRLSHQDGLIELSGRFEVGRDEATDGRVSWFRLYLPSPSP
jgi:hypothetical protein